MKDLLIFLLILSSVFSARHYANAQMVENSVENDSEDNLELDSSFYPWPVYYPTPEAFWEKAEYTMKMCGELITMFDNGILPDDCSNTIGYIYCKHYKTEDERTYLVLEKEYRNILLFYQTFRVSNLLTTEVMPPLDKCKR